jgi:hypothetical protein
MKREVFLLLLVLTLCVVSASVSVNNVTLVTTYAPYENISGEIDVTISGENYNELITSNNGDSIALGSFLSASGSLFTCSPPDCSNDYSHSSGSQDKTFALSAFQNKYLGFVLEGEDLSVQGISFDLESDFGLSSQRPLTITFFEDEEWEFQKFSDEFLAEKWGCYDPLEATSGPSVGELRYCEMIGIPDTNLLKIGAQVFGDDTAELKMSLYPDTGTGASWSCYYDPNSEDGCQVSPDLGEIFSAGDYQVCVSADDFTGYKIYNENKGENCGFVYGTDPENSTKDYGIFASGVKYAGADYLDSANIINEDILEAANNLISEKYGNDCSKGCALPIKLYGVEQNLRISNISLTYIKDDELDSSNTIYNLVAAPVTVDFDGVLDLGALGFSVSKDMEYKVSLGSTELFEEKIALLPAPVIESVFPLDPPAGVPIKFYAGVNNTENKSLSYKWDFGDGTKENTVNPYVLHTYGTLSNYTLTLTVGSGGNLTSTRKFNVNAVSPEVAINNSLIFKRSSLANVTKMISDLPAWLGTPIGKMIRLDYFKSELDRVETAKKNAFVDSDFVAVAKTLYALDVPAGINLEKYDSPYLITEPDDINIEAVQVIAGVVSGATNSDYANPILNWQTSNIEAGFVEKRYSVSNYSGAIEDVLVTYHFDVSSNSNRESYFVINRPYNELYFKESVGARKAGDDATVIIIPANGELSFDFYYSGYDSTTFFVSPKLSHLVIEADIDTTCNYNNVCEKDLGENVSNCRNDCKPILGAFMYIILSLFFVLIIYSILQIWYKRRYESYLFSDSRQLYNLLMYVTNARARGMKDDRIAAELRSQGWSSERVSYIIKKSRGQSTGLYEIIPFGKVMAFFRNRKAKKAEQARVATDSGQQFERNINKSSFPRRL